MKNSPLVSVIIPTYNRADVIAECVDSVLSQMYSNIEVIVVDDGSTDDTPSVLRKFGDRIRTARQPNAGPSAARNLGFQLSRGELIAFQDSDDLWLPTKLERQVGLLENTDRSVPCCLCNATFLGRDGEKTTTFDISEINRGDRDVMWFNPAAVLATRLILFNQMAVIRRSAFERVGGFNESLRYWEDYDLSLRLAFEGPWMLIYEPLVIYREGSPGSLAIQSLRQRALIARNALVILDRALSVADGARDSDLRKILRIRRLFHSWDLRAAQLAETDPLWKSIWGKLMLQIIRYTFSVFRRSPWYPKPITRPFPVAQKADLATAQLSSTVA